MGRALRARTNAGLAVDTVRDIMLLPQAPPLQARSSSSSVVALAEGRNALTMMEEHGRRCRRWCCGGRGQCGHGASCGSTIVLGVARGV